jgi:ATP-dependent Clp protease ATP-binding subunit ClpC
MMLTPGAEAAWMISAGEAAAAGHGLIEPAHLLIGVLSLGKLGTGADAGLGVNAALVRDEHSRLLHALSTASVDPTRLRRRARVQLGRGPLSGPPPGPLSRSLTCKAIFAAAEAIAGEGRIVGVAHLLAALAEDVDVVTARIIRQGGADVAKLRAALLLAGQPVAAAPEEAPGTTPPGLSSVPSLTPTLDRFGRDLTALARKGELGPIIGRRREILAVLQTLAQSTKNNPVLVGESGVGKTAIVEAVALRAAEGRDPTVLAGKRIIELTVGALVGGTEHRGAFEERVQGVIAEARAHPEILVYIDALHTLVGAGRVGQGGMDASNLLKPALGRGEVRCIGATTLDEYRRIVESDPALERRFEKIPVEEPDRDETLEILRGLRSSLERHHGVALPDEALAAAVDLSVRFEPDRRLPDKAIDLVDKAAARTRLPLLSLVRPASTRDGEAVMSEAPPVTPVMVARVLAEKRRLPLDLVTETLDSGMGSRLLALEAFLKERVLGQEEAIARVSRRLRLALASPQGRRGPVAVLLFLGPSGVGKTETARLLAEHLFGSASGMIRIDMSELMEEHGVSKLIGSAPGHGGPEDEGRLTDAIRAKPHALLLLDEVEKAHPRVLDVFLQIFDEGRITDSRGRTADARHLVVVMTSNLGSGARPAPAPAKVGPDDSGPAVADLRGVFRLELLNRIDEIVTFRALDVDDVEMIVGRALNELASAVERRHGVRVRVTPEAARFAAQQAALAAPGARGAKRTVERLVHGPLGALVLTGKLTRHTAWAAVYDEGGIYLLPEG